MASTLLITLCMCLSYIPAVEAVTLHFSGHGAGYYRPGLYRAVVDVDALLESPTYQVKEVVRHFTCTPTEYGYLGTAVRSMSYDATTNKTVVSIGVVFGGETVLSDETCGTEKACGENGPGFRWIMRNQTMKDSGKIRLMSSWSDMLYFVYIPATQNASNDLYRPFLQLRKVNPGHNFSNAEVPDAIEVESFSTLMANISVNGKWLHVGSTLLIVPGENNQDLTFLTVVRAFVYPKVENEDTEYSYYLVAINNGVARVLHTYKHQYQQYVSDLGGISYKDGALCWTMVDSIFCGSWSPEQPFASPADIETVLAPGQAKEVCELEYGPEDSPLGEHTTGVALLETPEEDGRLVLFFGCPISLPTKGGMGLLVKNSTSPEVDIRSVRYMDEPLHAALIFVTPDDLCVVLETTKDNISRAERMKIGVYILLLCLMLHS